MEEFPDDIRERKDKGCRFCGVLCEAAVWAGIWSDVQSGDERYVVSPFVTITHSNSVKKLSSLNL